MRLPDFVIAAMFDELLGASNQPLGQMTNHRFQLHRPVETAGGRSKRGLALALGFSDVVQQNSGGIKLDAIFFDKGFGTVDQETLNTALETLCSLTGELRGVGLISRTEQVKNLIIEGFDIGVTPSGSHIHARTSASRATS